MIPILLLLPIVSQPARRAAHAPCRAARNVAASDALDAAVKIAFLSAFMIASQDARYGRDPRAARQ